MEKSEKGKKLAEILNTAAEYVKDSLDGPAVIAVIAMGKDNTPENGGIATDGDLKTTCRHILPVIEKLALQGAGKSEQLTRLMEIATKNREHEDFVLLSGRPDGPGITCLTNIPDTGLYKFVAEFLEVRDNKPYLKVEIEQDGTVITKEVNPDK